MHNLHIIAVICGNRSCLSYFSMESQSMVKYAFASKNSNSSFRLDRIFTFLKCYAMVIFTLQFQWHLQFSGRWFLKWRYSISVLQSGAGLRFKKETYYKLCKLRSLQVHIPYQNIDPKIGKKILPKKVPPPFFESWVL